MKRGSLLRTCGIFLLILLSFSCSKKEEKAAPVEVPRIVVQPVNESTGEKLFNERCRDCHKVGEKGGVVGPDLSGIGSRRDRAYLERVIREPSKVFPGTFMPPYDTFSTKQIDSLVDYLSSQQ